VAAYEGVAGVMGFVLSSPMEDLPATTAPEYLRLLSAGEVEIEEQSLDGALAYIVLTRTESGRTVYLAAWGGADAKTVFVAKAESPEVREALVRAFVEAAS
jgi:hypothetical protein